MALTAEALQLLIRLHGKIRFEGPVLTFGVPDIYGTYEELKSWFEREGVEMADVEPSSREATTSIYMLQKLKHAKTYVHARTFFKMLGVEPLDALDASDSEGATMIHDLNRPVPEAWHDQYRWIIDGGTIEHIFDIRQALVNIVEMLAVGGHVMHMVPTNGWINHSFYQLSPTLFYDFYGANGFEMLDSYIVEVVDPARQKPAAVLPYKHTPSTLTPKGPPRRLCFVCIAQKTKQVEQIVNPTQMKYRSRIRPSVVGAAS